MRKINDVVSIPIDQIIVNPHQPRRVFNQDDIIKLAESIKVYGVIQPVSVRKIEVGFELIIGERRLRASKEAGLEYIPAIVVDVEEKDSAVAALIENIIRVDLNFLEEAEAIKKLLENHGISQVELSKRLGLSQSAISNKLRILSLPQEIRDKMEINGLSERHARAILKIDDLQVLNKILARIVDESLSVKKTEEMIQGMMNKTEKKILHKPKMKASVSNQIYYNTVKSAFDLIKNSNTNATMVKHEEEEYLEFIIRIPNH